MEVLNMWNCKHCNKGFNYTRTTEKANHSRHCDLNPKKLESYALNIEIINKRVDNKLGKYQMFDVNCQACNKLYYVRERSKSFPSKKYYFCSRNCANSIGGKAKAEKYHYDEVATYTTVAWRYHEKKCVACGEDKIVAVHHLNEIHSDNDPKNLVPLCPTHHQYVHSRYKYLVEDKINCYLKEKWG
jgi:hypothetical protein